MDAERLTLPEEVLLLGWNDEVGRNRSTQSLPTVLAGATVLDLVLREAVTVADDRLRVAGDRTGIRVLDAALDDVASSGRTRTIKAWVGRWGSRGWVKEAVLAQLVDRGVLRADRRRFLGLVPYTVHPVADHARVAALRDRVGQVLIGAGPVADARDAALGGLLSTAGGSLISRLVPRAQRRQARERAKALAKGQGVSTEVAKAISAANAAAMAAITAASTSSSSSS